MSGFSGSCQARLRFDQCCVCRRYVRAYAGLLHQVVNGKDLKTATEETSKEMGFDVRRATQVFAKDTDAVSQLGSACYINGAFKVIMYFAYKVGTAPALVAWTHRIPWSLSNSC